MSRGKLYLAAVFAGGVLLAGCQTVPEAAIEADPFTAERRSDPVIAEGPGGELLVEAGEFYFVLEEGVAIEGDVQITLDNVGGALHNFRIDEANGDSVKVETGANSETSGTLNLFAGEYTFYCDVPGHRPAGMEGQLVVYRTQEEATPVGDDPASQGSGDGEGDDTEEPTEAEEPTETPSPTDTES